MPSILGDALRKFDAIFGNLTVFYPETENLDDYSLWVLLGLFGIILF